MAATLPSGAFLQGFVLKGPGLRGWAGTGPCLHDMTSVSYKEVVFRKLQAQEAFDALKLGFKASVIHTAGLILAPCADSYDWGRWCGQPDCPEVRPDPPVTV